MRTLLFSLALTLLLGPAVSHLAHAQEAPQWMKQTYPAPALKGAVAEQKAVFNPKGALDAKTKYLIGLGVAAQIPCQYCIYFHTKAAKNAGATDAEIKEAIAAAALTRKWSTVLNGTAYNMDAFKQELNATFTGN